MASAPYNNFQINSRAGFIKFAGVKTTFGGSVLTVTFAEN
jgi:hypothetical protein